MDPMRNNNSTAVKRIARRSLSANRTRNIFAICAIVLTTFMLSSVFTIGSSLMQNLKTMELRTAGTAAGIFLKEPSAAQIGQAKEQSLVKASGLQIAVGSVSGKTADGKDAQIAMACYDQSEWEHHIEPAVGSIAGSYPKDNREIMLSDKALRQLGIKKPRLNQKLTLTFATRKNGSNTQTFHLSGWYKDYMPSQSGLALLSEAYCKAEGFTAEKDGRLSISCAASKSEACLSQLEKNVSLKKGQKFDSDYALNQSNSADTLSIAATLLAIALFIVVSGYLLIYNVIYISVTKDIRFYGMLKTIGASPRQITKLVKSQILRLSAAGIPIGLALSLATSFAVVPYALKVFNDGRNSNAAMPDDVYFNPWIFIAAVLFSLFTVIISCRKPAKIAGNVSPVEALKYTGLSSAGKRKDRKTRNSGKMHIMALHNIFRGKKRLALVLASLFMGSVAFLGVISFVDSMKVDNYVNEYLPHDFNITNTPPMSRNFDKDYMKQLSQIDGITDMAITTTANCQIDLDEKVLEPILKAGYRLYGKEQSYRDFVSALKAADKRSALGIRIYGIEDRFVEEYNKRHKQNIDVEAFHRGETGILGYDDQAQYGDMTGRSLRLSADGQKTAHTIEVAGSFAHEDYDIAGGYSTIPGLMDTIFVSEAFMKKLTEDPVVSNITIDVSQDKEPYVKQQLQKLNRALTDTSFDFSAKTDQIEYFQSSMVSMRILGGSISLLLLTIGILNFINVMLTGVYARRQELAVMESVGMTKRQIKKMLAYEGGYYAFFTFILILTVGNGLLYLLSKSVVKIADYAVYQYPLPAEALLIGILFVICLTVPRIVFSATSKESVTSRLRRIDN